MSSFSAAVAAAAERDAARALRKDGAWARLAPGSEGLSKLEERLASAPPDRATAALSAALSLPSGVGGLEEEAEKLLGGGEGTSLPLPLQGLISLLASQLSQCVDTGGAPLVSLPSPTCVLCGLTISEQERKGAPVDERGDPMRSYDPFDNSGMGEGEELLTNSLLRAVLKPLSLAGDVLWIEQRPCGHMLHDQCSVKLYGMRANPDAEPSCPACGVVRTGEVHSWRYGVSGTPRELELDRVPMDAEPDLPRMVWFDPRSIDAAKLWLPDPEELSKHTNLRLESAEAVADAWAAEVAAAAAAAAARVAAAASGEQHRDAEGVLEGGSREAASHESETAGCEGQLQHPLATLDIKSGAGMAAQSEAGSSDLSKASTSEHARRTEGGEGGAVEDGEPMDVDGSAEAGQSGIARVPSTVGEVGEGTAAAARKGRAASRAFPQREKAPGLEIDLPKLEAMRLKNAAPNSSDIFDGEGGEEGGAGADAVLNLPHEDLFGDEMHNLAQAGLPPASTSESGSSGPGPSAPSELSSTELSAASTAGSAQGPAASEAKPEHQK